MMTFSRGSVSASLKRLGKFVSVTRKKPTKRDEALDEITGDVTVKVDGEDMNISAASPELLRFTTSKLRRMYPGHYLFEYIDSLTEEIVRLRGIVSEYNIAHSIKDRT